MTACACDVNGPRELNCCQTNLAMMGTAEFGSGKLSKYRRQLEKYRAELDLPTICRRFADDLLHTEPHGMKLNIFDTNR